MFLNKQIPPTYQYLKKTLKIWVGKRRLRTFFLMPPIWSHTAERRVKLKSYWSTSLLKVIEKITACIPNPPQTDEKWLFKVKNTSVSFSSLFISSYVVRSKEGWSQNSLGFTSFSCTPGYESSANWGSIWSKCHHSGTLSPFLVFYFDPYLAACFVWGFFPFPLTPQLI